MLTRKRNSILIVIVAVLFSGCRPDMPAQQNGDDVLVYYDYYADFITSPQTNDSLDSRRVCYNISKEQVVWIKKNEQVIKNFYISYYDKEYSTAFTNGNTIIKIFPSCDLPSYIRSRVNTIYFQKIDKYTGGQVLLKKIVQSSEINSTGIFYMSQVVTDGTNYFFSCSNNFVYCFDAEGNLVWKKGNYPFSNLAYADPPSNYNALTYIYYDNGQLFFASTDLLGWKTLFGLNARTGEQEYISKSVFQPTVKQLILTKNHVIDFSTGGPVVYHRATGTFAGQHGSSFGSFPLGKVNDSFAVYTKTNYSFGKVETNDPGRGGPSSVLDVVFGSDNLFSNGIYFSTHNPPGSQKLTTCCIDLRPGINFSTVLWKKEYPFSSTVNIYGFKRKGDELFLFGDFHLENGVCVPNIKQVNGKNLRYMRLMVFSAGSGDILRQSGELPGAVARNTSTFFNFELE